jgi:beta-lactamase class C
MTTPSRREMLLMSAGFGLLAGCGGQGVLTPAMPSPENARIPDDDRVKRVLDQYIKTYCAPAQYITTALYDGGKTALHGYANGVPNKSVDTSWIFGIGSNTKVFTSTILAYECVGDSPSKKLTDPVVNYLPAQVGKQGHTIKEVTLVELATHTSSFPDSAGKAEAENTLFFDKPPSHAQIEWWIDWNNTGSPSTHNACVGKTPGTCYNYSDWGFITLGFAVAGSNGLAGQQYTDLLAKYVTKPLGLSHTGAHEVPSVKGYLKNGKVSPKLPTDLRSNAPDLLRFLEAMLAKLSGVPAPLQRALDFTQKVHWKGAKYGFPHTNVGLAWQLPVSPGKPQLIWKNGEAAGFTSFMGMIPARDLAVAILTNSEAADPTKAGVQFLLDVGG